VASYTRFFAVIAFVITALVFLSTGNVRADDPKAREIMQKVEDRDDGDNMTSEMEMVLIDKHNKKRVRKMRSFAKDKGEDTYRLMIFLHPADVEDTGFLTYDYDDPDRDDDQWLYLPALRKTKRIASRDKSNSFMGSDFNYSDMTSRELEDYDFALIREYDVKGARTWVIEAVPRTKKVVDETGYEKSMLFVRQDNYVVVRAVLWVEGSNRMKYMDVKNLELIDGIWVATETHMTTKKGKATLHKTVFTNRDVKFSQEFDFALFTVRRMEKGL
jgi:hypothetical protein